MPFVRFEKFGEFNDISSAKQSLGERLGKDAIDGKSDLYKILTLKLKDLIHNEADLVLLFQTLGLEQMLKNLET